MRRAQATLAVGRRFHEAGILKLHADRLERQEFVSARQRAVVSMQMEYEALQLKQKKDREAFTEFTNRVLVVLQKDRDRQLQPLELICGRLTKVLNERVPRERKKEGVWIPSIVPTPPHSLQGIRIQEMRPRTLGLGGLQVRQYINVKKPAKRPGHGALVQIQAAGSSDRAV
jgi:hypothetical protein